MQDQEVYFYTQTSKIHTVKSRFNKRIDSIKSVAIAFYYSGADAKILYDLANNHEGIVIAGSGSGNYSQAWLKAIEELSEKGIILYVLRVFHKGLFLMMKFLIHIIYVFLQIHYHHKKQEFYSCLL